MLEPVIPQRAGSKALSELQLYRARFQFSSLLETLIPPFEKQFGLRYEAALSKAAGAPRASW